MQGKNKNSKQLTTNRHEKNTIFLKSLWQYFNFDGSFVFRLTGCLHPAIFADTNLGTLSKDHTGTLCQHSRKGYPI